MTTPRALLIPLLLASCATQSPLVTERTPQPPAIRLFAPSIVMSKVAAPTEVLLRVSVSGADCFGVKVFWGDGESSGWITCDETGRMVSHKYRMSGELLIEGVLLVGDKTYRTTHTLNLAGN